MGVYQQKQSKYDTGAKKFSFKSKGQRALGVLIVPRVICQICVFCLFSGRILLAELFTVLLLSFPEDVFT